MDEPFRFSTDEYLEIAHIAQEEAIGLCEHHSRCLAIACETETIDAGPIVQGVIGGAIVFSLEAGTDPEIIRTMVESILDNVIPQWEMERQGTKSGTC